MDLNRNPDSTSTCTIQRKTPFLNGRGEKTKQNLLITRLTLRFKAIAAIYGTISTGLEGNFSLFSAAIANHFIHLARGVAIAVLSTTGGSASRAAARLILETFLSKESLFVG